MPPSSFCCSLAPRRIRIRRGVDDRHLGDNQRWTSLQLSGSSTGSLSFGYDLNGNRTSSSGGTNSITCGYNQADQLTSYSQGSTTASYAYDGDGLRTSKTVNGTGEGYVWNLAEGMPTILQDGSTRYLTGPGGLPIEQVDGSGTIEYYIQDQLGSTRGLLDASGTVVGSSTYTPYGEVKGHSGASTPFGYAGQYTDSESGLQYLRARYFDPSTAQFLTMDPLVGQTGEPYSYGVGDPLSVIDPTGLGCGVGPIPVPCPSDVGHAMGRAVNAVVQTWRQRTSGEPRSGTCTPTMPAAAGSIRISNKIAVQMRGRGWTRADIRAVIRNPTATKQWIDRTQNDEPATYYYGEDGNYVVRNNQSGVIIQISDRNNPGWIDETTGKPINPVVGGSQQETNPETVNDTVRLLEDPTILEDPLL